jgi:hypothetical protein
MEPSDVQYGSECLFNGVLRCLIRVRVRVATINLPCPSSILTRAFLQQPHAQDRTESVQIKTLGG